MQMGVFLYHKPTWIESPLRVKLCRDTLQPVGTTGRILPVAHEGIGGRRNGDGLEDCAYPCVLLFGG